jgi:hypothetical protein
VTAVEQSLDARARMETALLARRARKASGIPPLAREPGVNIFPVSAIQRLMWEFHHECPGESTWVTLGGIRLLGPVDLDVLQRALDALIQRHEAMRTLFRMSGGQLEQVILDSSYRLIIPRHEITAQEAEDVMAAVIDEPFDLETGPLVRLHVLRLSPEEHHLMLVLHHIVSDGRSMEIIIDELAALYLGFAAGVPAPLPPLAAQPADVAAWQRVRLEGPLRQRVTDYWTRRLAGAEPLDLPTDLPRPPVPSSAGLTRQLLVEPETMEALRRLARQHNATLFMVGLAAFQILFAWYGGRRDGMVATPYSYRDRQEIDAPVGAFINYLMLRPDLSGDPDFLTVLLRVRDATAVDFEHHELPFDDLISTLGLDQKTGRYTLMRAMFTEESDPDAPAADGAALSSELIADPPWHHALRDLSLRLTAGAEGTSVIITYREDAFTARRVTDIAADYRDLLALIAADPRFRVFDAPRRAALRVPCQEET